MQNKRRARRTQAARFRPCRSSNQLANSPSPRRDARGLLKLGDLVGSKAAVCLSPLLDNFWRCNLTNCEIVANDAKLILRLGGTVNTKYALMSVAIGGGLLLISESAIAQCVPVVYAFRHAEDLDPVTDDLPEYTDNTPPSNSGNPHSLTRSVRCMPTSMSKW